jgi:homoaconitase/3-isopropylmalate dehydratase large subunit
MTAVNMKIEKAMKSALVTPEYLLARYCRIYHSPSRKITARIRWE